MSFKLQAAMASGPRSDETKPRRFDLSMSRRTRRPAATLATDCHEQDHHQAVDVDVDLEGLGLFQPMMVQEPEQQDPDALFCLSDHLLSRQPEDDDSDSESQQQECQDNSHRFSLQELIEDEAVVDDGVKEENAAAAAGGVREVAEGGGAAAAGAEKRCPGQQKVAGRRVIGMMRRYVKVRSIKKPKRASPEKNAAPVC